MIRNLLSFLFTFKSLRYNFMVYYRWQGLLAHAGCNKESVHIVFLLNLCGSCAWIATTEHSSISDGVIQKLQYINKHMNSISWYSMYCSISLKMHVFWVPLKNVIEQVIIVLTNLPISMIPKVFINIGGRLPDKKIFILACLCKYTTS